MEVYTQKIQENWYKWHPPLPLVCFGVGEGKVEGESVSLKIAAIEMLDTDQSGRV